MYVHLMFTFLIIVCCRWLYHSALQLDMIVLRAHNLMFYMIALWLGVWLIREDDAESIWDEKWWVCVARWSKSCQIIYTWFWGREGQGKTTFALWSKCPWCMTWMPGQVHVCIVIQMSAMHQSNLWYMTVRGRNMRFKGVYSNNVINWSVNPIEVGIPSIFKLEDRQTMIHEFCATH